MTKTELIEKMAKDAGILHKNSCLGTPIEKI